MPVEVTFEKLNDEFTLSKNRTARDYVHNRDFMQLAEKKNIFVGFIPPISFHFFSIPALPLAGSNFEPGEPSSVMTKM